MEKNFLKEKYGLHKAPETESAAKRTEKRTGAKISQDSEARIQNYLDRLERLVLDSEKKQSRKMFNAEPRPRALTLLREMVMNKYVRPHKGKMAEGAARVEERAAREMGIEAHYGEQELEQRGEIAVEDLEKSLDNWILYLSDANEPYPTWFRYYVFRNVLDLGDYDKDKGEFTKRSQGSTRLFPDIDRGALAYVEQIIEAARDPEMLARLRKAQEVAGIPTDQFLTREKTAGFAKLSFAKQYAEGIRQAGEITPEMREEARGKWVKYGRGTDPTALWASLQDKAVSWCTKGFATAETQLKGGDFYVYYTYDKQGKPTIPRIAIRMQEDQVGEVRGAADNEQNLEGVMVPIAESKMKELPGAERYKKASADMKRLTLIETKTVRGEKLTRDDLIFVYEINAPIEGFGYQRDPRIQELRSQRNTEHDMLTILDCTQEQIAHRISEISSNTKVYLGNLEPGIFNVAQQYHIEHVFTSFSESKIRFENLTIGGKTAEELQRELKAKNFQVSSYAEYMLKSKKFTTFKQSESLDLVELSVKDLGFASGATIDQIYAKAQELGLQLCPAEVGPHYRLTHPDQMLNTWKYIAMKPIADLGGKPFVFGVERRADGLWLCADWTPPGFRWRPDFRWVFRLSRK